MKYKVGDKVIVREWEDMEKEFGTDRDGDIKAKCRFVKSMREHCGKSVTITGFTSEGNYWVKESLFIFSEDTFEKKHHQKIVITTDGVETLARLYDGDKVVKRAIAKCSPDDTFDFNVGAKLAFERLTKDEEKKPLTFREKLAKEYPEKVNRDYGGGCYGCPKDYGYESELYCKTRTENCTKCWDRVIPEAVKKSEPKHEETQFKIGERVKVVDTGKKFPTYTDWFDKNAPRLKKKYACNQNLENGTEGIVRAFAPHGRIGWYGTVYAIETEENKVYLIEWKGIEKIEK